jgi:holo-[acyl-carrier protein] synthase
MRATICHGIDLVEIDRLREVIEGNPAFEAGVFTEEERAYCRGHADPWPHFAARFAAKEAVLKALRRGLATEGPDEALLDVEVVRTEGAPRLRLYGRIARLAGTLRMGEPVISLTHAGGLAMASVVWPLLPEEGS